MFATAQKLELLSLPQAAARSGASLDACRQFAGALAAAGIIIRAGGVWVVEAHRANELPAALSAARRAARKTT